MQHVIRWTLAGVLASVLAACNSDISLEDFNVARRATNFAQSQALSFTAPGQDFSVRRVTQADLIGPQGQCAAVAPSGAGEAGGAGVPAQGGVALQMTECEIVSRIGQPDNMQLGTNERGERTAVLTYMSGLRPGIYRFVGGRLSSIERAPEPAAPARKAAPKKKRQAVKSTLK